MVYFTRPTEFYSKLVVCYDFVPRQVLDCRPAWFMVRYWFQPPSLHSVQCKPRRLILRRDGAGSGFAPKSDKHKTIVLQMS
jgi:hypothetical protein